MPSYLDRARAALQSLFHADAKAPMPADPQASGTSIDGHLVLTGEGLTFADPARAAADAAAWLTIFEAALERHVPVAAQALEVVRAQTDRFSAETLLWGRTERNRVMEMLRPRAGLAARLAQMRNADCSRD